MMSSSDRRAQSTRRNQQSRIRAQIPDGKKSVSDLLLDAVLRASGDLRFTIYDLRSTTPQLMADG
jgi:hypothetical protein